MCLVVFDFGLVFEVDDFFILIVRSLYNFFVLYMKSVVFLYFCMGYDDMNEIFIDVLKLKCMLNIDVEMGISSYVKFRYFVRIAGVVKEKD